MRCTYTKPDGEQCNANATDNSEYCFFHNPELEKPHLEAVTKGGKNRKHYEVYGTELKLETPQDIKGLLARVINGVWTGNIPSNNPANSIGFLSRCFLDAHEAGDISERITSLEERLTKAGL